MKDQNNCNHSKTAWKDGKKPVLTGEGLMNYSALRCRIKKPKYKLMK